MYQLKGFIEIDTQLSNVAGSVRALGDISTLSMTYARNTSSYTDPANSLLTAQVFKSATENGAITIPAGIKSQVFAIVTWLYTKQKSIGAYVTTASLLAGLAGQFPNDAASFGCGNLVNDDGFIFPSSLTWTNTTAVTNSSTVGGQIKLWFSDAAFQAEYDEYEIVVVPPLATIDAFLSSAASVASALSQYTQSARLNALQAAKGRYPETVVKPIEYSYVDPLNNQNRITTTWVALIYGAAGNTKDNVQTAIQKYIAANTTAQVTTWQQLFPEIYSSVGFYILPRWANVAIPGLTLQNGVYSSMVSPQKEVDYALNALSNKASNHVRSYLRIIPTNYNSLMLSVVSDPNNGAAYRDLLTIFPDLINVPTSDLSFNMMSAKTGGWVLFLQTLLIAAERATANSDLPAGMNRVVNNNILYVSQDYQGINYMVATKATTPAY